MGLRHPRLGSQLPLPLEPIDVKSAITRGSLAAPVGMVVYSDFGCPACKAFATETLPTLVREYVDKGRMLIAFRQFPIEQLHPLATRAAALTRCANRSGRSWETHDALFGLVGPITEDGLLSVARSHGLQDGVGRCLSEEVKAEVMLDVEGGRALKVSSTPSFLFGKMEPDGRLRVKVRRTGTASPAAFARVLDPLFADK